MRTRPQLLFALSLGVGVAVFEVSSAADGTNDCLVLDNGEQVCGDISLGEHDKQRSCSLYMAESTIPGAGLGMFSGVHRQEGDQVSSGDVVFPVVDIAYHSLTLDPEIQNNFNFDVTRNYVWFGPELGMQQETSHPYVATEYVTAFCPGVDAAVNCNLALTNVDRREIPLYDTAGLHRSKDPGAGSFTPYHKVATYATHDIPEGGELFKSYGDGWFTGRTEEIGLIPLTDDFPNAEELMHAFNYEIERHSDWPESVRNDVWDLMVQLPWPSRLLNALPKDHGDLDTVLNQGIRAIYQPKATRALSELEKHGRCLDYIASGPSTIRQAGRGAFATRFLPKGTIVGGSPLLFAPNPSYFEMYSGNWMKKDDVPDKNRVTHYQIFYNYCYHHPESSIFLCPYGSKINYINHGNKTQVNVRLQWAKDGEMGHNGSLLKQSPQHMMNTAAPGLFLDFVATRDIQAGEEIFLDYGAAWEGAWQQHVVDWETKFKYSENYQSARNWDSENMDAMLRTEEEQSVAPYPSHFELRCLDSHIPNVGEYHFQNDEALKRWNDPDRVVPGNPCRIIDRKRDDDGNFRYKVLYKEMETYDVSEQTLTSLDEQEWIESDWIVRGELRFADVPYSTDIWLPGAFRHPIGLPDDIFPDAWRGEFLSYGNG